MLKGRMDRRVWPENVHKMYPPVVVKKSPAPGEARTHGLQIMRLTRCLLRYGGIPLAAGILSAIPKHLACLPVEGRKYLLYPRGDSNPQSSV